MSWVEKEVKTEADDSDGNDELVVEMVIEMQVGMEYTLRRKLLYIYVFFLLLLRLFSYRSANFCASLLSRSLTLAGFQI